MSPALTREERDAITIAWNGWIDDHRDHGSVTRELMAAFEDGYRCALDAAKKENERGALDMTRLPERFRFSREVYGDVADDATRVLLALTDGGHADQPSDYLRWVSITAAQALAARPAPTASTADADVREALLERVAAAVDAVTRLGAAVDAVLAALGFTVADEGRAEA